MVRRGVGRKKDAAMQPTNAPHFAFHAASLRDDRAGMLENSQMERFLPGKASNEDNRLLSRTNMPDSLMEPSANLIEPSENKQSLEPAIRRSSSEVAPESGTFSSPKIQMHIPTIEPEPLALSSINRPTNNKNDDKVIEKPEPAEREDIPSYVDRQNEKVEADNITPRDALLIDNAKRLEKKATSRIDAVLKDIPVTAAPTEPDIGIVSSKTSNLPESKTKLSYGKMSAEGMKMHPINLQDQSVALNEPAPKPQHSAMSSEASSVQPIQPSSLEPNKSSSFIEISEPARVQTPISRFEIFSKIHKEVNDAEDKRPVKIMPSLSHSAVFSELDKGSTESREPDQINVSIGAIDIKAESQPVPLPAEPAASYGFSEYEPMRRYLSWERG